MNEDRGRQLAGIEELEPRIAPDTIVLGGGNSGVSVTINTNTVTGAVTGTLNTPAVAVALDSGVLGRLASNHNETLLRDVGA
jgi:hypothetical protein